MNAKPGPVRLKTPSKKVFKDVGVLSPETFLRVVELDLNPAFCEIAHIASRGFIVPRPVLGFTIKPESFRTHIGPVCSTRFRMFKEGRQSPSSGTSTTAMGASTLASSQSPSRRGGTTSNGGRRFLGKALAAGRQKKTLDIPPGLYGFDRLKEVFEGASSRPTHALKVSRENGLITLTVASGWGVLLSDGLLTLLGLGGVWLDAGVYTGDRPVNFATRQMLWVHLDEINTAENIVDGAPSTLLAGIGLGRHAFGDINTVRMECPEYKRLRDCSTIGELKISIRDGSGKAISNQDLPIHVTLEVVRK